jgi:hypothetical protein
VQIGRDLVCCYECNESIDRLQLNQTYANNSLPDFTEKILSKVENDISSQQTRDAKDDLVEKCLINDKDKKFSYKSRILMNLNEFNLCEMRFLDQMCNKYQIYIALNL